jgi:hypothetical protein
MAVTTTPAYHQAINNTAASIANADTQTKKTIFTPGSNGSRISAILVSSTDTSTRDLVIGVTVSATNYDLGIVSIPIQAGTLNTAPTVSVLTAAQLAGMLRDAYGNPYLDLKNGVTLYAYAPVTITSAKQINILTIGADL